MEYGLNAKQQDVLIGYITSRGEEYVREKAQVVRRAPRRNAAGALLAALRDDWQPPVNPSASRGLPDRESRLAAAKVRGIEKGWAW
jgi:hypothetical protein